MCCGDRERSKCQVCTRMSQLWIEHCETHSYYTCVLVTGQPRSGKTTLCQRMLGHPVISRFSYHIECDKFLATSRICLINPWLNGAAMSTMTAAVLIAGRIPIIDHVDANEVMLLLGARHRIAVISTDLPDAAEQLEALLLEYINRMITFRFTECNCSACDLTDLREVKYEC